MYLLLAIALSFVVGVLSGVLIILAILVLRREGRSIQNEHSDQGNTWNKRAGLDDIRALSGRLLYEVEDLADVSRTVVNRMHETLSILEKGPKSYDLDRPGIDLSDRKRKHK